MLSRMARGRSRVENSVAAGVGECGCELSLSCRFREILVLELKFDIGS